MSTLSLQVDQIRRTIAKALTLLTHLRSIERFPRTYVAEMIVVRLFALFEAVIEDSACHLICGSNYCDGSATFLQRTRPTQGFERARNAMQTFNRTDPHNILRWSAAREIKQNLEKLFPPTEHFINTVVVHGQFISDLRKIRNHIAHGNASTRRKFNEVVRNYYGADVNAMTPGRMLLSSRFSPLLLEQFCRKTQVILLAAIKG